MEALALAGIKAELLADGLPTHGGGLSVSAAVFLELAARLAEHGDGWMKPRRVSKQPAGPSGAAHERKRERGHTEMERARKRKQTGQRASSATGRPPNDGGWVGWLAKLKAYKSTHGDCNVPLHWAEEPELGRWVADQQR